jgi:hypothetical protein
MGRRMSSKNPIWINGERFNTKTDLRNRIRALRDKYEDNVPLENDDFDFMLDLLRRHEEPDRKIGCGVWFMYVKANPVFKSNRGFWLVRHDGSETDFSFEICLKHETKMQKFKSACRTAIADDILKFRNDFFVNNKNPYCELTGQSLEKHNCHVDHKPPMTFDEIVTRFIKAKKVDVDTVKLLTAEDGRIRNELADQVLKESFIVFHRWYANLRVISRWGNLSISKKQFNGDWRKLS